MKAIRSLGSLGAVTALFCAPGALQAAVLISSSVVNVPITSGAAVSLDVDGDMQEDFSLSAFVNSSHITLSSLANTLAVNTIEETVFGQVLNAGDTVGPALTFDTFGYLYNSDHQSVSPSIYGSFDIGVHFTAGDGELHYGWFRFSFPSGDGYPFNNSMAVSAAWESQVDQPVAIVPEPSALTCLGALAAMSTPWLWYLRRK